MVTFWCWRSPTCTGVLTIGAIACSDDLAKATRLAPRGNLGIERAGYFQDEPLPKFVEARETHVAALNREISLAALGMTDVTCRSAGHSAWTPAFSMIGRQRSICEASLARCASGVAWSSGSR